MVEANTDKAWLASWPIPPPTVRELHLAVGMTVSQIRIGEAAGLEIHLRIWTSSLQRNSLKHCHELMIKAEHAHVHFSAITQTLVRSEIASN